MASVAELRSTSTLSRGTSFREVRSGDPAAVGEVPHLDRTPPPGPKHSTSIISHTSAYGKIRRFPAGQASRHDRRLSYPRPRVARQAVAWGRAIRLGAAEPQTARSGSLSRSGTPTQRLRGAFERFGAFAAN